MSNKKELEENFNFKPQFDSGGLIPCVTTCADTGVVLMFAFMNEKALRKTIDTGEVHYWSRSRKELWHKGATSGHIQKVHEMRTDCDQDCIWVKVKTDQGSCHTGRNSCFYRKISSDGSMEFIDADQVFDPKSVYR